MKDTDESLTRAAFTALAQTDRIVGLHTARSVAAGVLRLVSRTRPGYVRSTYRLVERRDVAPVITRLPSRWWTRSPAVAVRRLGLQLDLDLRDNLQRVLYFTGTYEPDVRSILESVLRKSDVFIDAGAHIGVHALPIARRLRKLGGGTVIAFEPSLEAAIQLEGAANKNGLDVHVVRYALSDESKTLDLRRDRRYQDQDLGVLSEFGSGDAITSVHATSFDSWARTTSLERMHAVKLDIEGGELAALRGMRGCITQMRPRVIIVETKEASLARASVDPSDIHEFLQGLGYRHRETVPFSNDVFVPS